MLRPSRNGMIGRNERRRGRDFSAFLMIDKARAALCYPWRAEGVFSRRTSPLVFVSFLFYQPMIRAMWKCMLFMP
jgi:hypothetical protein